MRISINLILSICFFIASTSVDAQWTEENTGIPFTLFSVSAVNNNIVWAAASGANMMRTTNGGQNWVNVGTNIPPPMGVHTNVFALDENTALFANYAGNPRVAYVYKTTNAGGNWSLVFSQGSNGFITAIWLKNSLQGFMVGWPVGGRWSLWRTSNGGNNWDSTGLYIAETNPSIWSFENSLYVFGSNIWFGARGKGIYYSSNDGTNWTLQDLTGGGFPYPSGIWFENATTGFSSGNLNIIRTTNGGTNWTVTPGSTGSEVIRGITGTGSQWWYVREINPNIYYTSDNGNNWVIQHTSPSGVGFKHITKARTGNTLWAVNISGNVAKYVIPTGIEPLSELIPSAYGLSQNYPNPFNPVTKIKFDVPLTPHPPSRGERGVNVRLIIYDVLGHEVVTLVNEELDPGTYEVVWDGTQYPSGVYFYTLKAGVFHETKKMLMIK